MGQPQATFINVVQNLCEAGIDVVKASSLYLTKAWGYSDSDYTNAILLCSTSLPPAELLHVLQHIEKSIGRVPSVSAGYEGRIIDLDIIDYDLTLMHTPTLTLPHAQMANRGFVLFPLLEVYPAYMHPGLGTSIEALIASLPPAERVYHIVAPPSWCPLYP